MLPWAGRRVMWFLRLSLSRLLSSPEAPRTPGLLAAHRAVQVLRVWDTVGPILCLLKDAAGVVMQCDEQNERTSY